MSNSVNLSLDVTKTGIQNPLIKVRQGDGGFETLRTTVTANGEPMDLQGWTITFMGTTAGNHKIVDGNVTLVEAPNGIFDYTPSKAWGMDIGDFKIAYFKFVKGDGSASSANFRVSVIEAVDLTQEEAQNYISVVDTTIATINQHLNDSLASVTKSITDANNNANTVASNVNTLGQRVDDYNNKLAAIQVGGRNLLLGTSNSFTGIGSNTVNGTFNDQGGQYYLAGNKKVLDLYNQYGPSGFLTISFDWAATGNTISGQFNVQWNDTPWGGLSQAGAIKPSATNKTGHYETTVQLNYDGYSTGLANGIRFRQDNLQGNVTISNFKLEAGNIATDWTPAPEDVPSNDAQLVHKTGTETIAGNKTFTSPINGQLITEPQNLFFNSEFENSGEGWQINSGGGTFTVLPGLDDILGHTLVTIKLTSGSAKLGNNRFYPAGGGVHYSLSSLVNAGTTASVSFVVDEFDGSKTNIKSTPYTLTSATSWGLKTASFVTQSQTKFLQISYQVAGASGQSAYLAAPMWNTGTTPLPYVRGSEMQVIPDDSNIVHKTSNETVAGDKTFTGISTLTSIKSSNVKTGSVALNGLTIDFRQTVVGVNVYMHGTFSGSFGTDQSYVTSSSVVPSNINNPKQTVVLTIVSNGGVSGVTNNSPWELEVLLNTSGAIQYRAKNLRDNDITARNTSIVGADSAFYTIE